jgi:hypothetical protein
MIDVAREFERLRDYLVGRLPDDEVRDFEDRLVRDPELAREFEQSLRLRAGMQELRAQGYFAVPTSRRSRLRVQLAALAAAVIAAIALLLWMQTRTGTAPIFTAALDTRAAAAARQVAAHYEFVAVRGGSTIDLNLPAHGMIEFEVAPPARAPDRKYRLTLLAAGAAQPIGILEGIAPRADGFLYGYADAARLSAGGYVLRVETQDPTDGPEEMFRFKLRPGTTTSP